MTLRKKARSSTFKQVTWQFDIEIGYPFVYYVTNVKSSKVLSQHAWLQNLRSQYLLWNSAIFHTTHKDGYAFATNQFQCYFIAGGSYQLLQNVAMTDQKYRCL